MPTKPKKPSAQAKREANQSGFRDALVHGNPDPNYEGDLKDHYDAGFADGKQAVDRIRSRQRRTWPS